MKNSATEYGRLMKNAAAAKRFCQLAHRVRQHHAASSTMGGANTSINAKPVLSRPAMPSNESRSNSSTKNKNANKAIGMASAVSVKPRHISGGGTF